MSNVVRDALCILHCAFADPNLFVDPGCFSTRAFLGQGHTDFLVAADFTGSLTLCLRTGYPLDHQFCATDWHLDRLILRDHFFAQANFSSLNTIAISAWDFAAELNGIGNAVGLRCYLALTARSARVGVCSTKFNGSLTARLVTKLEESRLRLRQLSFRRELWLRGVRAKRRRVRYRR